MRFRFANFLILWTFLSVPGMAAVGFEPQQRLGAGPGDQWEPSIAADGFGNVYVLYPQYLASATCRDCYSPHMLLQVSADSGQTWEQPRPISPVTSRQFDPQITIDPADRRTVYASWLQNDKHDVVVAKSADFGQSWSAVVAARSAGEADKPVLAVRASDVYVAFSQGRILVAAASHDGGITFSTMSVNPEFNPGSAQAGGSTVDPDGNVFVSWTGYVLRGPAKGSAILYVSKSADRGASWSATPLDISRTPPECRRYKCSWEFLGPQITITSDAAGTLYALWNSGRGERQPQRIYFASSTTAGETWSPKSAVSTAARGAEHAFPAIAAADPGDVRIAWMDTRRAYWNTYYRSSTNGGASWSPESKLSTYRNGYSYIYRAGFNFPFGDYFGLAIDAEGRTHAAWGEGLNFDSPGSIWYANGR